MADDRRLVKADSYYFSVNGAASRGNEMPQEGQVSAEEGCGGGDSGIRQRIVSVSGPLGSLLATQERLIWDCGPGTQPPRMELFPGTHTKSQGKCQGDTWAEQDSKTKSFPRGSHKMGISRPRGSNGRLCRG